MTVRRTKKRRRREAAAAPYAVSGPRNWKVAAVVAAAAAAGLAVPPPTWCTTTVRNACSLPSYRTEYCISPCVCSAYSSLKIWGFWALLPHLSIEHICIRKEKFADFLFYFYFWRIYGFCRFLAQLFTLLMELFTSNCFYFVLFDTETKRLFKAKTFLTGSKLY